MDAAAGGEAGHRPCRWCTSRSIGLGTPISSGNPPYDVHFGHQLRESRWAAEVCMPCVAGRLGFSRVNSLRGVENGSQPIGEVRLAALEEMLGCRPGTLESARRAARTFARKGWPVPPLPDADFVGREAEVTQVCAALRTDAPVPLVVVSGPSGAGKTALSRAAAALLRDRFQTMVQIVLPPPGTPPRQLGGIGVAFGFGGSDLVVARNLLEELAGWSVLVLIDDIHHGPRAVDAFVQLLRRRPACSQVAVLATSLPGPGLRSERTTIDVAGLPLGDALHCLLGTRGQLSREAQALRAALEAGLLGIGCLPGAIGRVRTSARQAVSRGSTADVASAFGTPKARSAGKQLAALDPNTRRTLLALALCPDTFTIPVATTLSGRDFAAEKSVVADLVARHLVEVVPLPSSRLSSAADTDDATPGEETRYSVVGDVREHAQSHLSSAERAEVTSQVVDRCVELSERHGAVLVGRKAEEAIKALHEHEALLLLAMRSSVSTRPLATIAILSATWRFWRGRPGSEASTLGEQALAAAAVAGAPGSSLVAAKTSVSTLLWTRGQYEKATTLLLDVLNSEPSKRDRIRAELNLVCIRAQQATTEAESEEARRAFERSCRDHQAIGDSAGEIFASLNAALVPLSVGDHDAAIPVLRDTLRRCQEASMGKATEALIRVDLGFALVRAGGAGAGAAARLEEAAEQLALARLDFESAADHSGAAEAVANQARLALVQGRADDAFALAEEAFGSHIDLTEWRGVAEGLELMGMACLARVPPDEDRAALLLGAGNGVRVRHRCPAPIVEESVLDPLRASLANRPAFREGFWMRTIPRLRELVFGY